jgi:hypothetical protein
MKRRKLNTTLTLILLIVISCNEPETTVTNIVHPDGSVTRRIEMRNSKNEFKQSEIQVPLDSTWIIRDSIEISGNHDTTWLRRAEKIFKDVNEINLEYISDKGANKEIKRKTEFVRKFRWFNTLYRFSEIIDKKMSYGYAISKFLNPDELVFFYSPESIINEKKNGPDSLKIKALEDTINKKVVLWTLKSLVSEWIGDFTILTGGEAEKNMKRDSLKAHEDQFVRLIDKYGEKFDSLWSAGILLKEFIGEANALKYKTEADSAAKIVEKKFNVSFKDYSVKVIIPGKVIGTNGFIDKNEVLIWPVRSDFFLTQQYEMWTESKVSNKWTWIVTGLFLIFVFTGLLIRVFKR